MVQFITHQQSDLGTLNDINIFVRLFIYKYACAYLLRGNQTKTETTVRKKLTTTGGTSSF